MQDTPSSSQEAPSNLTLREYGDILRRRRAIILQTFVIVLVIGILVNLYTPLTYSAMARLLTEPPQFRINSVNGADPLADLFSISQQYTLLTQVQMLQRAELQKKVGDKLNVQVLPKIDVKPVEGTQIIEATAEGENPELVANTLNTLLDAYIDEVNTKTTSRLHKALDFATRKSEDARKQIASLEQQENDFKVKNSLFEVNADKQEYLTRVNQLTGLLDQTKTDLRTLVGRIEATTKTLQSQKQTLLPFLTTKADPRIEGIDDEIAKLEASKAAAMAQGFTEEMPQVQQEMVQITRMKQRKNELLTSFVARNTVPNPQFKALGDAVASQNIEMVGLQNRMADLQRRLTEAQARLKHFPDWERQWIGLQSNLAKQRGDYEYFSNQENILRLKEETSISGPQVLQRAVVPIKPIRPNREQNILFAALLGVFFGLCLALLQELFDDRINSPEEAERVLRLPSLGLIPMIEEEGLRLIKDTSRFSPLMESYRSLRTNINFAAVGHQVRALVVTSSVPAEGKSTTVANLAMAMAMENKRVIIIDADLRRPSLHKLFKVDSSPGLTDVLVGTHTIEEVIRPTGVENVAVIAAGSPPPNPAELLGSAEMGKFLADLETLCDVALFDSPPALAVADSVVLASRANGVILVIGYGETKKTNTRKAIEVLSRANAHILGTVLNRMEGQSGGYYYGKYYVPVSDKSRPSSSNGNGTSGTASLPNGNSATNESGLAVISSEGSNYNIENQNEEEN